MFETDMTIGRFDEMKEVKKAKTSQKIEYFHSSIFTSKTLQFQKRLIKQA